MSELSTSKLDDIADVIDSLHKTPKYSETGYPMVRCVDLRYGSLKLNQTRSVSEEVFAEYSRRYKPKYGDIIVTRVGANFGVTSYVEETEFCLGQNTAAIVPTKINARYLYYILNSSIGRQQMDMSVAGAAQPTLSLKAIKGLDIPRLGEELEEKIASMIGVMDDKIELNRQTNQTLEQIAQAIFKSWFVDFEPTRAKIAAKQNRQDPEQAAMAAISGQTIEELEQLSDEKTKQLKETAALFPDALVESELGEIPEGWESSEIGKEVTVVGGGTPSTKNEDYWEGGHINWTSPKDMSSLTDKILLETGRKITKAGLTKISSGLLPANTVLMSSRAPVGYLAIAKIPVAINQGYIAMKCEAKLTPEFVVQWAESVMDEIKQRASGTTFAEISKKNFKIIPVVVPHEEVLKEYSQTILDLYEKITEALRETKTLIETRDTLLPKLLSGELELVG